MAGLALDGAPKNTKNSARSVLSSQAQDPTAFRQHNPPVQIHPASPIRRIYRIVSASSEIRYARRGVGFAPHIYPSPPTRLTMAPQRYEPVSLGHLSDISISLEQQLIIQ